MFDMIKNDAQLEIINFGYSGRTMSHKSPFPYVESKLYKQVMWSQPDYVLIMLGINDSKDGWWDENDYN